ncbi:ATP-binding protein [Kutzneria sp. NPDC052558]|uniref:ATP-binding protein n=1 Tax=Kutzneria sp. NPDC052558 TaxID=3364121 RepID=UPI0037C5224D
MAVPDDVSNAVTSDAVGSVIQAGTINKVIVHAGEHTAPAPVPRQLPAAVRDFTGRDGQVAALDALLPTADCTAAVAVIDGAGGAGKTSLVVHWAHHVQDRFPDGTLFVNLRGYGPSAPLDPALVLTAFLTALGIPAARLPIDLDALAGMYRSALATRRVLVVLDNAANAAQVRPILPGGAGCMAMVTSRDSLTELVIIDAAKRVRLDLFSTDESHGMLRGLIGSGRCDAEPDAVTDLVRICAGLPLAVRVAATRLAGRPHLLVADVVADITDGRRLHDDAMSGGASDVDAAVQSVFDWSYARLPDDQARVFRLLGLHPGPEFDVRAVAAITGLGTGTAYRCLEALAELHLVEPAGRRRYATHDLLHFYAARRVELDDAPADRQQATRRVLGWYAGTAQYADQTAFPAFVGHTPEVPAVAPTVSFADRAEAMSWFFAERPNVVAAVRQAGALGVHDSAIALAVYSRFLIARERAWSAQHLEITAVGIAAAHQAGNLHAEALLLSMRAETWWYLGKLQDADADLAKAMVIADGLADAPSQIACLLGLGLVRLDQGRLDEATECYHRTLTLATGLGLTRTEAVVHCNLSDICTRRGDFRQALVHADRGLALRQAAGDRIGEAYAFLVAAVAWQGLGEHETAVSVCNRAAEVYRSLGHVDGGLASVLLTRATSSEHLGDPRAAVQAWCDAAEVLTALDDPRVDEALQRAAELERQ